ncbi:MAG: excinuclease ABC subunit C [Bacteroidetes bacterium]|nr:MAG: excinuclease ABC subunit C [Bacteroidota bacterium]
MADLLSKLRIIPEDPGVYRFLDKKGKIIYIGKAKNLRKRVGSYFAGGRKHSYRIEHMVRHAGDVEYTVVHSEIEALLLENNLIKNHQPRYNILLKDGKTYPYICIKNERFPRVFSTRQKISDGSAYYGPYPSVGVMNSILNLIRGLMPLRTCNFDLSEKNVQAGKFKRCLEFQIGNCAGPCEGLFPVEEYDKGIEQVRHILKGNLGPVLRQIEERMNDAAGKYEFERAEFFKNRLEKVRSYQRKTTVVSEKIGDLEVITVATEENLSVVNHFKVHNGAIIQTHAFEFRRSHEEEDEEVLTAGLARLIGEGEDLFPDIVTNISLDADQIPGGFSIVVPQIGDKRHLVDLSLKNCHTLLKEKLYDQTFRKRRTPQDAMMEELQKALSMSELPDHIECFDNSNFQGSSPVASCVVFKQGRPAKKDYRHFNIKTVEGPDDFASMEEIVYRRYKRVLDENLPLPKLIVIDGGKGQLSSAAESLKKLDLLGKIPVIGIAKRLEEIYRPGDSIPLHIDKKSAGLHLIQQIRNEAHRFAITHHRDQRSKKQTSMLSQIKGIGKATEQKILQEFKSVKKLKEATEAELSAKLGAAKAKVVMEAIREGKV